MKVVAVRDTLIGDGVTKICIPIVGRTEQSILTEASELTELPADLVEWRCDFFDGVYDINRVGRLIPKLREILPELPIMFTLRSMVEGGRHAISAGEYRRILKCAIDSGAVDIVDVEINADRTMGEPHLVDDLIQYAHEHQVYVIASCHNFRATPSRDEMIANMMEMVNRGADIAKMAYMPIRERDVLTLLDATLTLKERDFPIPVVSMSMSAMGMISRLTGEWSGSAITFGSAKAASAPGQPDARALRAILTLLQN